MGRDKATLCYHGKPQALHLYELLKKTIGQTYISCRADQNIPDFADGDLIVDLYPDAGPVGGILSAFKKHPQAAWLVVACDMPFIDESIIEYLMEKRNPYRVASSFYNDAKKWSEPLLAIYEPKAAARLGDYLIRGYSCPRKILMNSNVHNITPPSLNFLENINTPTDFAAIKENHL